MNRALKKAAAGLCLAAAGCTLTGCYMGNEPNNIAYITAMGLDNAPNGNLNISIQFAKPTQISGGAAEEGGKGEEITEMLTVEAPTIYAGLNLADNALSKKFSMAHIQLFVISDEIARNGVEDIIETMARSQDVRPNVYMAVAQGSSRDYLEAVKPVVEINPAKYYRLVFEKNNFGGVSRESANSFYFFYDSPDKNNVLPLAGVVGSETNSAAGQVPEAEQQQEKLKADQEQSQGGQQGKGGQQGQESQGGQQGQQEQQGQQGQESQGGQQAQQGQESQGGQQEQQGQQGQESQGGQQGQSQDQGVQSEQNQPNEPNPIESKAPENQEDFEFHVRNYRAGELGAEKTNKSEIIGMAIIQRDKMIATMGSIESLLYHMLSGSYEYSYVTFREPETNQPVTIRLEQDKKPKVSYSKEEGKVRFRLYFEGDFTSLSASDHLEHEITDFEQYVSQAISRAAEKFLYRTSRQWGADVVGIGSMVKSKFPVYGQYLEYDWERKYSEVDFQVDTHFKVRRSGLTIRSEQK